MKGDGVVMRHNVLKQTVVIRRDEDGVEVEAIARRPGGEEGPTPTPSRRAAPPHAAMARVYITTPLYYVNAEPHLGHTYTTVVADTLARWHRAARRRRRCFVTGTDEHGDKIAQAAAAAGVDAEATYADRVSALFRDTWDACGISYDHFIRTTDAVPRRARCRRSSRRMHAAGDIYFGSYGGLYCYGCERFYTEKELVDGKCPDHQVAPTYIEEENYFFRMSTLPAARSSTTCRRTRSAFARSAIATRCSPCCAAKRSATCASRGRRRA